MEENIKSVFNQVRYKPNSKLSDKIWDKIIVRNRRIAYFKITSYSIVGVASLLGFIPMFGILANDFTQSGFYEYLSLAFSKGGIFSAYWKEFAFSLAESLPTMSIVYTLTLVLVFFLSLHYVIKQIINNNPMGRPYGIA
ncbi:MAG: hypothetical protein WCG28_02260 [bacterium]